MVAAGEGVGRVDGGIAGHAEEGVVDSAVPPGSATEAAVASARRLRAGGAGGELLVGVVAHGLGQRMVDVLFFLLQLCYARSE